MIRERSSSRGAYRLGRTFTCCAAALVLAACTADLIPDPVEDAGYARTRAPQGGTGTMRGPVQQAGDGAARDRDGGADDAGEPQPASGATASADAAIDAAAPPSNGAVSDASSGPGSSPDGAVPPPPEPAPPGPTAAAYTPAAVRGTGPRRDYTLVYPSELGRDGKGHPIVVWANGLPIASDQAHTRLLDYFASQGFVVLSHDAVPTAAQLSAAIDWLLAEQTRPGSLLFGRLDPGKVAAAGHAAGATTIFEIAADPRLTTTLHLLGSAEPGQERNLRAPTAILCGDPALDPGQVGCGAELDAAVAPIFTAVAVGERLLSSTDLGSAGIRAFEEAASAWLRWQLLDDSAAAAMFLGPSCLLCSDRAWRVEKKNLD